MKVKFANRVFEVLYIKKVAGLTMYAVEDEPNHFSWIINAEVIDDENKELEKVEPKFKIGDWIVFNGCVLFIEDVVQGYYRTITINNIHNSYDWSIDNAARLWTIQDIKDSDTLCYKDEISIYKHNIKNCIKEKTIFGGFVYYCCYDGERFIIDGLYSLTERDKIDIHPATKEQRNLLFSKMKEAGYKWDCNKKELIKIEQKNVWSEEDEEMRIYTCKFLDDAKQIDYSVSHKEDIDKCISWLKSIKTKPKQEWSAKDEKFFKTALYHISYSISNGKRIDEHCATTDWLKGVKERLKYINTNTWKPTDEQMNALKEACDEHWDIDGLHPLYTLWKQLNKLKE